MAAALRAGIAAALLIFIVPAAHAAFVADSVIDYSGTQGLAGWQYGQWDTSSTPFFAPMNAYDTTFHFGADVDYRWYYSGFPADVTWWNTGGHTSTTNTFSAVRRFTVPQTGTISISGSYSKLSSTGGDGVVFDVRRNGVSLGAPFPHTYNSLTSATFSLPNISATAGDVIDLAIQRNGTPNFDASNFQALIRSSSVNVLARSFQEFSGVQGTDNWRFGRSDVAMGSYSYLTNFIQLPTYTPATEQFGFGDNKWTGPENSGLYEEGGHPQNNTLSVIRRWTSEVAGTITIEGILADLDGGGGNGIIGSILHNGVSIYSQAVANNNLGGFAYSVTRNVAIGDQLDFVIDPNGEQAFDSTRFTAIIYQEAIVPEPSSLALAALGLIGLTVAAFRRHSFERR